jgi:hypothetical protein
LVESSIFASRAFCSSSSVIDTCSGLTTSSSLKAFSSSSKL